MSQGESRITKLSRYFLECIAYDYLEVSAFASDKYDNPDYVELKEVPYRAEDHKVIFGDAAVIKLFNKARRARGQMDVYWGYPTRMRHIKAKSGWQGFRVEPILIFKIHADFRNPSESSFGVTEFPRINYTALEGLLDAGGGSRFIEAAVELAEGLGLGSDTKVVPDLDELFARLQNMFPVWPWREDLKPDKVVITKPFRELSAITDEGLYNRPIMVLAEKSKFTAGLEAELAKLVKMTDEDIQGTALHDWLYAHTDYSLSQSETLDPLLEVLPLNEEQRAAVHLAMTDPLVVVTGPPGTGKSQVVTSVLVNSTWRGQKVLFSSKNNKAVDVVEARANGISSRPVVLRLGANDFQAKLADYLSSLLSAASQSDDRMKFDEAKRIHARILEDQTKINGEISAILKLRNTVDDLEQSVESLRELLSEDLFAASRLVDLVALEAGIASLRQLVASCDASQQPWYVRAVWIIVRKKRYEDFERSKGSLGGVIAGLEAKMPSGPMSGQSVVEWIGLVKDLDQRFKWAQEAREYFQSLEALSRRSSPGDLAKQSSAVSHQLSEISRELWIRWLALQPDRLQNLERRKIQEFTSILRMIVQANEGNRLVGKNIIAKYHTLFAEVAHFLPCWAVSALSARSRIPFQKAYFDLVVIDESSQCDIASILPLLYRSKRAMVIGDPKQLRHITSLSMSQDRQLLEKADLQELGYGWAYAANSLFDLAQGLCPKKSQVILRDHHRSRREIIEFSNECFYAEAPLRVATAYDRLVPLPDDQPAVRWINVVGEVHRPANGGAINRIEAHAVYEELQRLMRANYKGSIGVVTPFRAHANAIRDFVYQDSDLAGKLELRDFLVDVVHSFQGDERDLMIFSPVISKGVHPGAIRFLQSNGNLFNVAITRAKSCLITVGDKSASLQSKVDYLEKFVKHTELVREGRAKEVATKPHADYGPNYPTVAAGDRVSEWEKILYRALYSGGIKTMPQYSEDKYRLDFALKIGDRKLNIEVDGEMYHRAWDGELCRRDQIRNRRLIELGWDVMRFWVYEIRDDMPRCIERVQSWFKNLNK